MTGGRMMFGEEISKILGSWGPVDFELILVYSVTDPVAVHVNRVGADHVIGYSMGRAVVTQDGRGQYSSKPHNSSLTHRTLSDSQICSSSVVRMRSSTFNTSTTGHSVL